ncbi:MAG: carbohydrate kinase family protein [bacterium]
MFAFDVVAAGHICLDIIPPFAASNKLAFGKVFQPGKLLQIGNVVLGTGGPVSNTGIALSKLGGRVAFMAKVGNDAFGQIIVDKMSAWGNAQGIYRDAAQGSSYSVILAPPGIDRIILHHPGCNDSFTAETLNWDIVRSARHFHLGYPPLMRSLFIDEGEELAGILQKVKALGVSTSLDLALPDPESEAGRMNWRNWFVRVLPHVDFFTPSIEEIMLLRRRSEWESLRRSAASFVEAVPAQQYHAIAEECLALGCGVSILKAGHHGMYARTANAQRIARISLLAANAASWANRELWGAAYHHENVQSAAGAGDSAVAGILTATLLGKTLEETLQFGNCLGYQNLRALDTVSGVGTLAETETLLKSLRPVATPFLDQAWQATSCHGVLERNQKIR